MLLPSVEVTGGPLPNAFCDTIFENNELTKEGMNAARLWAQSINGRTSQNVDSDGKRFNIAISMYNDRSDDVSHYVLGHRNWSVILPRKYSNRPQPMIPVCSTMLTVDEIKKRIGPTKVGGSGAGQKKKSTHEGSSLAALEESVIPEVKKSDEEVVGNKMDMKPTIFPVGPSFGIGKVRLGSKLDYDYGNVNDNDFVEVGYLDGRGGKKSPEFDQVRELSDIASGLGIRARIRSEWKESKGHNWSLLRTDNLRKIELGDGWEATALLHDGIVLQASFYKKYDGVNANDLADAFAEQMGKPTHGTDRKSTSRSFAYTDYLGKDYYMGVDLRNLGHFGEERPREYFVSVNIQYNEFDNASRVTIFAEATGDIYEVLQANGRDLRIFSITRLQQLIDEEKRRDKKVEL